MKRLILLSFTLLATMMSWAETTDPADFVVKLKDGTTLRFLGESTEMSFDAEGAVLFISNPQLNFAASYAVEGIESIDFLEPNEPAGGGSLDGPYFDVTIDPTDDTSYTEVSEEVITDASHADYGDFIENYTPTNRVTITYDGDKATVSGTVSGVKSKVTGAHVVINSSKKNIAYTLKGTTTNGSFKLYSNYKTQVTMDGADITNPTGAAINIQSGKTIMVELADGTTNKLADGTTYTMTTGEDQKGTFFSEGQLIFSGNGSLAVQSVGGHGIVSDDYVRMRNGNITVNSVRDGINTNDCFIMYGGTVNVTAQQDGLDIGKGYVEIGGGKLIVNAIDEGITASYEGDDAGNIDPLITPYIDIKGGLIKITTTGEKGHAVRAMSSLNMTGGIVQTTAKGAGAKAVMSEGNMSLTGGKLTAFTEGNALYKADTQELSSATAIRSKGTLKMENMIVGLKSTGTGGKGINNIGNVTLKNSTVTVVASGANHKHNALDSRSHGIETDGSLTLDGSSLHVRSYGETLLVGTALTFMNSATYAGYQVDK
ncbi:MAG: carbohydrate-binding domain-containing protein [Bacteroidaceae bacterium]|nr:carbohydrate-binding domain-containing protein [Bacteroidaceae bacterium]